MENGQGRLAVGHHVGDLRECEHEDEIEEELEGRHLIALARRAHAQRTREARALLFLPRHGKNPSRYRT